MTVSRDLPVSGAQGQVTSETGAVTLVGQDDILAAGDMFPRLQAVLSVGNHLAQQTSQSVTYIRLNIYYNTWYLRIIMFSVVLPGKGTTNTTVPAPEPDTAYLPVDGGEQLNGEHWCLDWNEPLISVFLYLLLHKIQTRQG